MRTLTTGLSIAAFALSVPALAALPPSQSLTPGAKPAAMANKVELRSQVPTQVAAMFAKLDSNKDGAITGAEIDALRAQRMQKVEQRIEQRAEKFDPSKMIAQFDSNKDGKLTKAEVDTGLAARAKATGRPARNGDALFARLDTNRDGLLTLPEVAAMKTAMENRKIDPSKGPHGLGMFAQADQNKDGRVTLQEAQSAALQQFDRADANKDGKVTPDERKAMMKAMRAARKG